MVVSNVLINVSHSIMGGFYFAIKAVSIMFDKRDLMFSSIEHEKSHELTCGNRSALSV